MIEIFVVILVLALALSLYLLVRERTIFLNMQTSQVLRRALIDLFVPILADEEANPETRTVASALLEFVYDPKKLKEIDSSGTADHSSQLDYARFDKYSETMREGISHLAALCFLADRKKGAAFRGLLNAHASNESGSQHGEPMLAKNSVHGFTQFPAGQAAAHAVEANLILCAA